MPRPDSQSALILAHLEAGNMLTPIDALQKFGCFRLGARIYDLKQEGYNIEAERVTDKNGKRYARYRLLQ